MPPLHRLGNALHGQRAEFAICEQAADQPLHTRSDEDLAGFGQIEQPRRVARRLAQYLTVRIGDDKTTCHADTYCQPGGNGGVALGEMFGESEPGVDRAFGGVFLRDRVAEQGNHLAHHTLRHNSTVSCDDCRRVPAIRLNDRAQLLRIAGQAAASAGNQFGSKRSDIASFGGRRYGFGRRGSRLI
ncbi:MAG TPA: hypothetical protein VKI44_38325 [Acetobacteraceae bacterium]|nr:hypothetical protein [Acetobacteraceae bacterium]